MRVKILQGRVGTTEVFNGGSEYDIPDARAQRWIAAGFAVAVDGAPAVVEPVVETPVVATEPEVAVVEPVVETTVETPAPEIVVVEPVVETATKSRGRRK